MPETLSRRAYLLTAIQNEPGPVSTQRAAQLLAASPWPTSGRNTVRKDLRSFVTRGYLRPDDSGPYRIYHLHTGEDGRS